MRALRAQINSYVWQPERAIPGSQYTINGQYLYYIASMQVCSVCTLSNAVLRLVLWVKPGL